MGLMGFRVVWCNSKPVFEAPPTPSPRNISESRARHLQIGVSENNACSRLPATTAPISGPPP